MDCLEAYWTYLVSCSRSLILDHGFWTPEDGKPVDLQDIVMVQLSRLLLKDLGQIGSCRNLRICILADNFLTGIEALMECRSLVKLDLKGNQIVQLPDALCWSPMKELQLLYLHDNNIGTWNHISGLSGCSNLTALTLFDTPLSLKKNYRHCVVNNIWSLKALDHCVISDEEIIQNCFLSFQFKAMKPHFHVNLYPSSKSESFETEMKAVYKIIAEINRIQAFCCPTLVLQRWIRGHLIRKSLGLCGKKKQSGPQKPFISNKCVKTENEEISSPQSQEMMEDTKDLGVLGLEKTDAQIKRLHVNLDKLMQAAQPEVSWEAVNTTSSEGHRHLNLPQQTPQHSESLRAEVHLNICDQDGNVTGDPCDEEIKGRTLRVLGLKVHQTFLESLSNTSPPHKTVGHNIIRAISHVHTQRSGPQPLPQPQPPAVSPAKRLIGRCHDHISFTPFKIIEKAHRALEKAEMQRNLVEKVTEQQVDREVARGHRYDFMEAKRTEARLRQEHERADMEKTLTLQRTRREQDIQQVRQKHSHFLEDKRWRVQAQKMVCSFSGQHNSLARAVLRYNTWKRGNQQ